MKILFVSSKIGGGVKTYIDNLTGYFSKNNDVDNYIYNNKKNLGKNYISKKIYAFFNIIYPFYLKEEIKKKLNDFNPDVVHFNSFSPSATPILLCEIKKWKELNNKKCSVIYTAHNYELICLTHNLYNSKKNQICEKCICNNQFNCVKEKCLSKNKLLNLLYYISQLNWMKYNDSYKIIDKIICCSHFMKSKLDMDLRFKDKTIAIHNFAIEDNFMPKRKENYIIYFGRYTKTKGIGTLLQVIKKLSNINFVFAGFGALEKEIEAIPNITNVGMKSGNELKELISQALFSIIPSEWYENCPFAVIESQIYGTPVLGANIGGIPELIDINKTGEIFESGNCEDLKKHIIEMFIDSRKLKEYSKNCIEKKFISLEEYANKLLDIYKLEL